MPTARRASAPELGQRADARGVPKDASARQRRLTVGGDDARELPSFLKEVKAWTDVLGLRRLKEDTRPKLERDFALLTKRLRQRRAFTAAKVAPLLEDFCAQHMRGISLRAAVDRLAPYAVDSCAQTRRSFRKRKGTMHGMVHVQAALAHMGETGFDIATCVLWLTTSPNFGQLLASLLVCNAVVQAGFTCFYMREGKEATAAALVGLKSVVEGRRALYELPPGASRAAAVGGSRV